MAQIWKCPGCGQDIYAEFDMYHQEGRRYWHQECWDKKEAIKAKRKHVVEFAAQCLGEYAVYSRINSTLDKLLKSGLTYDQIERSLDYWYNIKGNDPSKSNGGLGIVDFIHSDADSYFQRMEKLKENQEKAKNIDIDISNEPRVYVRPRSVNIYKKKPRFSLE